MSDPAQALALPEALFAAIISATQGALYRFVCRLVNDSEQARDIVQDVFVEAVRAAQRQAPPFVSPSGPVSEPIDTSVRRWLFQVASHRAISFARHRRVLAWESLERLHAPESHRFYEPVPFEDRIAEGEVLHAALAQLTPEDVALVVLKEVEGFTIAESIKILALDISLEAAKKRFQRASERLRAAYFAQDAARGEWTHR